MYLSIAAGLQPPDQVIRGARGIEILDRDGQLVYAFADEPGSTRIVSLDEISPFVVDATVAAEDANFWNNPGVNVKGLGRAVYENLAFWENGGFFNGSGGSSLSQQLAKNLYIKPEERAQRSPLRKVKETIIAFELTRRFSKEEILSWYLSNVSYGNGAYGIESASYRYFNKPPADLTLAESAMLAGIPRAPAYYDPIADFNTARLRQEEVLDLMVRHKFLTPPEREGALDQPLVLREGRHPNEAGETAEAIHFALYVRDLLPAILGKDNVQGQLRVTTTLDLSLQSKAEDIVKTQLDRLEPQVGASNGALVSMDPRTGEILAMVGSHDFSRDDISGQVNNALTLNQPGSTMKPMTYLAAFMAGWSPSTVIVDEPIKLQDGDSSYTLNNADLRYRGSVTARTALGSSLNVPAVKALEKAGLENVYNLDKRMGLTTLDGLSNYGPAFTLGGVDVSLLDHTYVFSVLANQGQQSGMSSVLGLPKGNRSLDPIAVLKIESVTGKKLWEAKPQKERIVPANATYLVTHILSDDAARVSMFGANSPLKLPGRPAAVKSGLTDDARDAWAVGYTPSLVTGVWVGNANNQPMPGASSTYTAVPIWSAFMQAALQGKAPEDFPVPEGVSFVNGEVYLANQAPKVTPTAVKTATPAVTATPQTSPTPVLTPVVPGGLLTPTATRTPIATLPATATPPRTSTPVPTQTPITQLVQPSPTRRPTERPEPTNTPRPPNNNGPNGGNGNNN
jgi:membrane peptidoglycan carboxypeptidase